MPHFCTSKCEYKRNLNAAAADWSEAAASLADSVGSSSDDMIDRNYAWYGVAKAKFMIVMKSHRDHVTAANANPETTRNSPG
jgi:hypothetical protein